MPLRDKQGSVVKWYGTTSDIENRKRTAEALQEAQDKFAQVACIQSMGELAAATAHEVNQPLTAIVTNANFSLRQLKGSSPNLDELRTAFTEIAIDGTRASAVISRIRGLLTKRAPRTTDLDVNQIIQQVIALLSNELGRNRISLGTDLATGLPRVPGDPVQLQVLINLIMNAVKAMRPSTGRPKDLLIRSARNPDGVLVRVQDSDRESGRSWKSASLSHFLPRRRKAPEWGSPLAATSKRFHGGQLSLARLPGCAVAIRFTGRSQ